jgi:hypothetical protein
VKHSYELPLLKFDFKGNDQNRAIHGSEVIFKIKKLIEEEKAEEEKAEKTKEPAFGKP